jgi:hypothetical protein
MPQVGFEPAISAGERPQTLNYSSVKKKYNFAPKIIDLPYAPPACPSGKGHDVKYNLMWLAFKDRLRVRSRRP